MPRICKSNQFPELKAIVRTSLSLTFDHKLSNLFPTPPHTGDLEKVQGPSHLHCSDQVATTIVPLH